MIFGYARVSTRDQEVHLQRDALLAAGAERIFEDVASGTGPRPQRELLLSRLRAGDSVLVYKLDRLGRGQRDILNAVHQIADSGAVFRSLTEKIETESPVGRMFLSMLAIFAELEREIICERTRDGLEAAKRRGQKLGRRPLLTPAQAEMAEKMVATGVKIGTVASSFRVSPQTIRRAIRQVRRKNEEERSSGEKGGMSS